MTCEEVRTYVDGFDLRPVSDDVELASGAVAIERDTWLELLKDGSIVRWILNGDSVTADRHRAEDVAAAGKYHLAYTTESHRQKQTVTTLFNFLTE